MHIGEIYRVGNLMKNWKSMLLKDFCIFNANTYGNKDVWIYVNYLDTGNITNNKIEKVQYIDLNKEKLPSRARRKISYNSIIYSTVRPNQLHYGIIKNIPDNFLVSTGFVVIDVDEKIADADFIYYWLSQSSITDKLQAIAEQSTSTYPSIKVSDLAELEIYLPPLWLQKNISGILSIIDKKITNNDKINRNLSEQAKFLFKEKFLDVGCMLLGWKEMTLDDVAVLSAGGDKPEVVSEIRSEECNVPIYSNGISNEGIYGFTTDAKIMNESVTVSARGTIGFVCLRQEPYVPIVRLISVVPKENIMTAKFLYLWLESLHIMGTGTTQQQLTVPDFKKTRIIVPSIQEIRKFTDLVNPSYDNILRNKKENEKLSELRDNLLPKLMSGELDISDLDI